MWMIAGLGNPGKKYEATRHNLGFRAVDTLLPAGESWREQGKSLVAKAALADHSVLLVKPQNFMNLSGEALQPLLSFYKIPPSQLLVLVDDIQLPCGKMRLRPDGSHGGQNGLRNIIEKIGPAFPRLRLGAGLQPPNWDRADWVLSRLTPDDDALCCQVLAQIPAAVNCLLTLGIDACRAQFNG